MAEFEFDALSLIEDVEKETKESSKARKDFVATVQNVGNEHLNALVDFNEDVSDLAAQQARIHQDVMRDLNEADRIQNSIPLSILHPTLSRLLQI